MTGKIEPALTPEEWATFPNWPMAVGRGENPMPNYHPSPHGTAAANLYGQSYGFTHEDVRRHREDEASFGRLAQLFPDQPSMESRRAWHESMAERIAALLPPEAP